MATIPVPDDIKLDSPNASSGIGTKFVPVADDIHLDGEQPTAAPLDHGALRNVLTAAARIPGVVLGAPDAILNQLPAWLAAQAHNAFTGDNETGADVRAAAAKASAVPTPTDMLPTGEGVDRAVFSGVSALAGRKVEPYEPTTAAGKLGAAALTALGGGVVDPVADVSLFPRLASAVKSAFAGGVAEGAHELFPSSDVLPFLAAVATHAGTTAAGRGARAAGNVAADTGRQLFAPSSAGTREAASTLARVENSDQNAALAQPSPAQARAAELNTRAATDAIGSGVAPYQAGANIRTDLASQEAALKNARKAATTPIREARDASTAQVDLDPVLSLIGRKLGVAAGDQAKAINGALTDLRMPSGALREQADQLAASRQAIDTRIETAKRAGDDGSAKHLLDIRRALDNQINGAVPEAAEFNRVFAEKSRPLDVFDPNRGTVSAVGDAISRDPWGAFNGTPPSEIPDSFLRGSATKEKLDQLVSAYGGDRTAAMSHLEQFLAGKVQAAAVHPDGTFDTVAYSKAMQPYTKSLNGNVAFWMPDLARKFENAKAAQATLERLQSQRSLADAVTTGALRDDSGAITAQSFGRWLKQNEQPLADTQSPAAVMRLKQIAGALQAPEGELADAIKSQVLPAATGVALGGAEGGFLGATLRRSAHALFSPLDTKRQAAFNSALERAVLDPAHAQRLVAEYTKRRRYLSPARALAQAVAVTPATVGQR
jgi:hypothetical protein